jgi:hypothetical protein
MIGLHSKTPDKFTTSPERKINCCRFIWWREKE